MTLHLQYLQPYKLHERAKRYGFRVKCYGCGGSANFTGIKHINYAKKKMDAHAEYHRKNCKSPLCFVATSYHAAEIETVSSETDTDHTVSSTTFSQETGWNLAGGSFTGSKEYFLQCFLQSNIADAGEAAQMRVVHGSTTFADSTSGWDPYHGATSRKTMLSFMTVFTQTATPETIYVEHAGTSTDTVTSTQCTMFAMNLTDDLASTDWYFNYNTTQSSTLDTTTSTGSGEGSAKITFTPSVTGDWMVCSHTTISTSSITISYGTRITSTGTYSETAPFCQYEPDDTDYTMGMYLMRVFTSLTNTEQTFEVGSEVSSSTSGNQESSAIFALRLDAFETHGVTYNVSEASLSSTNFATEIIALDYTPDSTGSCFIEEFFINDVNKSGGYYVEARLQIDGSDSLGDQTGDVFRLQQTLDERDEMSIFHQHVHATVASTQLDIDVDGSMHTGGNDQTEDKCLMAFSLELAAGSTAYERTATQTITISHSNPRIYGANRSVAQTITESDSLARIHGHIRTVADTITQSDSVALVKGFARTAAQTITQSNSISRVGVFARTIAQAITESDSIARQQVLNRTASQTITESDGVSRTVGKVRAVADSITILINSATRIQGHIRPLFLTITESDSVTRAQTLARTATQTITQSDTVARVGVFARTVADTITQSDVVALVKGLARTATQTITISGHGLTCGLYQPTPNDDSTQTPTYGNAYYTQFTSRTAGKIISELRYNFGTVSSSTVTILGIYANQVVGPNDWPGDLLYESGLIDPSSLPTAGDYSYLDILSEGITIPSDGKYWLIWYAQSTDNGTLRYDSSNPDNEKSALSAAGLGDISTLPDPASGFQNNPNRQYDWSVKECEYDVDVITGKVRTAAQTITQSDSVARVQGHIRTIAQSITESDIVTRTGVFVRAVADSITESDGVAIVTGKVRTATQTITQSDSAVRVGTFARTVTQTITQSDAISRVQGFVRNVAQNITESDSTSRTQVLVRAVAQAITESDTAVRSQGFVRTAVQTITQSDVITRAQVLARTDCSDYHPVRFDSTAIRSSTYRNTNHNSVRFCIQDTRAHQNYSTIHNRVRCDNESTGISKDSSTVPNTITCSSTYSGTGTSSYSNHYIIRLCNEDT